MMMMMMMIIYLIAVWLCMREINKSDQISKPETSFSCMEQNCGLLNVPIKLTLKGTSPTN